MKKLLVLPGNSPRNRQWGEECAAFFADRFDEVVVQLYDHWESGEAKIDFVAELEKIAELVELGGDDTEWYIFAKSIGSVLALLAVEADVIEPERCVFFGMPLDAAEAVLGESWAPLTEFAVPALVFHNDHDPVADHTFTKDTLAAHSQPTLTFVTLSGTTHDYLDFAVYNTAIADFSDNHYAC